MFYLFVRGIFIILVLLIGTISLNAQTNINMSDVPLMKERYTNIYRNDKVRGEWIDPSYRTSNWWDNEIGIPWKIANTILLGRINKNDWEEALREHLRIMRPASTHGGANDAWSAITLLAAGMALEDKDILAYAKERMLDATTRTYSPRDHDYQYGYIMEDNSYHFHGFAPSMRYGQDHFLMVAHYLYVTENTSLGIYGEQNPRMNDGVTNLDVYFEWFHDFIRWYTYRGMGDPSLYAKLFHGEPDRQYRDRIQDEAIPYLLKLNLPNRFNSYISELQKLQNNSDEPYGAMSYPTSTYLSVRRNNFYGGLKMANVGMPKLESGNLSPSFGGVNVFTPHTVDRLASTKEAYDYGDRLLNLTVLPEKYYYAIHRDRYNPYGYKEKDIILQLNRWGYWGVLTLGGYFGAASQDLDHNDFKEKVSWFFFDDEIVHLGSGISASGGSGPSIAIVNTFKVKDSQFMPPRTSMPGNGQEVQIPNQNWLYHDRTGYYFLENRNLKAKGIDGYDPYFVQLSVQINEQNGKFALAYLPNTSQQEMEQYSQNGGGIEIIALTEQAHIVRDKSTNIIAASFFAPTQLSTISSNSRAYLLYQATGQGFYLSLYNPHHEVKVPFQKADEWGWYDNPMLDYYIHPNNATSNRYEIEIPVKLSKATSDVPFDLIESSTGTKIVVNLRVTRKFEISGDRIGNNQYSIDRASIKISDSQRFADGYQLSTGPPQIFDSNPPSEVQGVKVRKQ